MSSIEGKCCCAICGTNYTNLKEIIDHIINCNNKTLLDLSKKEPSKEEFQEIEKKLAQNASLLNQLQKTAVCTREEEKTPVILAGGSETIPCEFCKIPVLSSQLEEHLSKCESRTLKEKEKLLEMPGISCDFCGEIISFEEYFNYCETLSHNLPQK